jgi:predicted DNA-binding protein
LPGRRTLERLAHISRDTGSASAFALTGLTPAGLRRMGVEKAAGSSTKSLRLADAEWAALERLAKQQRTTVHALLREAVAEKLHKPG